MIKNPILPGFNPDPCICRKRDDYYLAVSTFEWFPVIPVYHSRDLKNWELYTHVLTDDQKVDLMPLFYMTAMAGSMWYLWNGKPVQDMKSQGLSVWWNMTQKRKK